MNLMEHLEALRWHLVRGAVAIGIGAVIVFLNKLFVFNQIILAPKEADFILYRGICKLSHLVYLGDKLCMEGINLTIINIELPAQFLLHLKVSFIGGFIIAFPYLLWELWRFVQPGLYAHERKYARGLIFFCSLLFFAGVLFGYYVLSPFSINFLGQYQVSEEVTNQIHIRSYVNTLMALVLACGLIFEMPALTYFLAKMGLVTPDLLRKYRKHAIIILLALSAFITPPDVVSQVFLVAPLYVLYEISIFIAVRLHRKRAV
jgi:sec-independent protein translocase protein TatC